MQINWYCDQSNNETYHRKSHYKKIFIQINYIDWKLLMDFFDPKYSYSWCRVQDYNLNIGFTLQGKSVDTNDRYKSTIKAHYICV